MNVEVKRDTLTSRSTMGQLYVDGRQECFTLEPPQRAEKPCAIPPGTRPLTIRWSVRFQRLMPHIENVEGFEGVELHTGNYPSDTIGCTIVGLVNGPDLVLQSHIAFERLWAMWAPGINQYDTRHRDLVIKVGRITHSDPPPTQLAVV